MPIDRKSISDAKQLQALASPTRQEIFDSVVALRDSSAREIAEALGRPVDGLYFHLRKLVSVGLLEEFDGQAASGRTETRYRPVTRGIVELRYRPSDPDHSAAVRKIAAGMFRSALKDFSQGLTPELARLTGSGRNILTSRQRAWVTPEQLEEVNALLARLQEIFHHSSGDGEKRELLSITVAMAPISAEPVRRGT